MSDHGLPCWGVAGSKGFDSWAAALEKTEASLALSSPSSPKTGAGFVSQDGVICTAVGGLERGHQEEGEGGRTGEGGGILEAALGQAQGWGRSSSGCSLLAH